MASDKQAPLYAERRDDTDLSGTGATPEKMSVGRYFATRFPTLRPRMDKVENPITLLRMLNRKQWLFFLVAFFGWTWDVSGNGRVVPQ